MVLKLQDIINGVSIRWSVTDWEAAGGGACHSPFFFLTLYCMFGVYSFPSRPSLTHLIER